MVRAFIPWVRRFFRGDLWSLASTAFDKDKWDDLACFIFELGMRSVGRPVLKLLGILTHNGPHYQVFLFRNLD